MTVAEILTRAGETEAGALREHAVLLSLSKLSHYEAECRRFEKKYSDSFEPFHARVRAIQGEEDFEVEDDLIDWEYAHRSREWWACRVEELRNAG